MEALKRVIRAADELGIEILTVYAFSTENWRRPQPEVEFLLRLPGKYLETELAELKKNNIRVRVIGVLEDLPGYTREAVTKVLEDTAQNTGLVLNFALNYGSRAEITRATREIAAKAARGELEISGIDEEVLTGHLETAGQPDPDLLIRSSGEMRLSNFLLWQLAYAELWFSDVYWPDFDRQHLFEAVAAYQRRNRRYGWINP
jgi:undecaprenyl diphosphate synthase